MGLLRAGRRQGADGRFRLEQRYRGRDRDRRRRVQALQRLGRWGGMASRLGSRNAVWWRVALIAVGQPDAHRSRQGEHRLPPNAGPIRPVRAYMEGWVLRRS